MTNAPILMWDKPKKKMSSAAWKDDYGFDGGPTGGYQPNMSADDTTRWKAKITGTKLGFPQVEIRRDCGSLVTIIVNLGAGYNYKQYTALSDKTVENFKYWTDNYGGEIGHYQLAERTTSNMNVHIAMNGPAVLTFEELAEMQQAIEEAKVALSALEELPGERELIIAELSPCDDKSVEALSALLGVRVHYRLDDISYVGISAPKGMRDQIKALSCVVDVMSLNKAKNAANEALNRSTRGDDEEEE